MGTGEASGEKRAILAAEAAIANPLLDEVSMKGARGCSFRLPAMILPFMKSTGGGRIRQESMRTPISILGATFDESLDGIVRVSVVATGIRPRRHRYEPTAAETRIAEVTNRLRRRRRRVH